jgi:tetratricopeptide (TPR) repeat protein
VWPARLYADYSPAQVVISSTPDPSQVNGLLIACGAAVLVAIAWRRSAVAAFGLFIACVVWLPTANFVFPSGVLLAERTLYLPSGGVLLAAGAAFEWLDRRVLNPVWMRSAAGAALAVVLVLGTVRSIQRQRVWRSSDEVFWTMMRDEPLSFKAHYAWGDLLFERGDRVGGEREWRKAMRIFPTYHKVYQDLARRYMEGHLFAAAIPLYQKAIDLGGPLPLSRAGIVACQLELAQFRAARHSARLGMIDGDDPRWFRARLFSAESALVANDSLRR